MRHVIEDLKFGTKKEQMAALLEAAAEELLQAKGLLLREESDFVGYLVQKEGGGPNGGTKQAAVVGRDRLVDKSMGCE
jgi:hypothetical protein